jgi:protein SCO1
MRAAVVVTALLLASLVLAQSHDAADRILEDPALPRIGPAPEFALTSQDGKPVRLADFRGKVVSVSFIYTVCPDTCPVLTPMMSFVQDRLGRDFGTRIVFLSITVDPERDTQAVLKEYAQAFGADLAGWAFLTGAPDTVREVTRRYGVLATKTADGDVDHSLLTSIVDRHGILRVQYLGARFDPEEFRRDLLSLAAER